MNPSRLFVVACALASAPLLCAAETQASWKFQFGSGAAADGFTSVAANAIYSKERGFGFEPGASVTANADGITSEAPLLFSVAVPEGNFRVAMTLVGAANGGSVVTVKSESRRLMLENVRIAAGTRETRIISVNVRNSSVPPPEKNAPGGDHVVLNDREQGVLHWDDKLTLEFNGTRPSIASLEITKVDAMPTIFVVGDSTVTDQPREPGASWGQMITRFLKPDVAVANHAESGETMKSFMTGLRLAKVLSQMKAGDWLFMQFGHNDEKKNWPQTYVEAHTTYKIYLKVFIAEARLRGATPVLVTSMQRRNFGPDGKIRNTHGDYPECVREVAKEENVALIDLDLASRAFYEALGPEKSPLAFAGRNGSDPTHHNNYGAYELAKVVAQGIRDAKLDLAKYIVDDFTGFDPTKPDPVDAWSIAPSPGGAMTQAPRGN